MASRSHTPVHTGYDNIPTPNEPHLSRGYGNLGNGDLDTGDTGVADFANTPGNPSEASPLAHSTPRVGKFDEDFEATQRGSSVLGHDDLVHRSTSNATPIITPSRSGTLKKRGSVKRTGSIKRSSSRRSLRAGSIKGVSTDGTASEIDKNNSIFYTPVPTSGSPTEILVNRFQAWRRLLKDIITYFREVQASYEQRSKALLKVSNVISNTNAPSILLAEGGINDANRILRDYHKQALFESNKARDIENDVITQLSGLRADLAQKCKEIKSLASDFKNSVDKEKEGTRRAVAALQDALDAVDTDPHAIAGKGDPYVVRLAVDRQVERQIDEENYLHRAYLNLEGSGRELESIVVGEIQKAYNALAGILKRDADEAYGTVERLRTGPIVMPKDREWTHFVEHDPQFVDPRVPLRRIEDIDYPGKHHPAAVEVKAGMLERKSKYLKSYTPGWYVLSPTHLHEFKSADKLYTQPPVMSLYLADQKLGSHSQPGSSSHKFMLKGRQTGSMHRGHSWVFRAESYETMLQWYNDIKALTEKSGEERNAFVRRHVRSASQGSMRAGSISSAGSEMDEDEADEVPYSATSSVQEKVAEQTPPRPQPGGRFPSDIQVHRNLQAPLSPSSGSSINDQDLTTATGGLGAGEAAATTYQHYDDRQYEPVTDQTRDLHTPTNNNIDRPTQLSTQATPQVMHTIDTQQHKSNPYTLDGVPTETPIQQPIPHTTGSPGILRQNSTSYGEWMASATGGVAAGALGAEVYRQEQDGPSDMHTRERYLNAEDAPIPVSTDREGQTTTRVPVHSALVDEIPESPPPSSLAESGTTIPTTLSDDSVEPPRGSTYLGAIGHVPANRNPDGDGPTPTSNKGVHETGEFFPPIIRQNTDISISQLHIPGEYPKTPAAL
ncbi:hypothetical protein M501DRAFT_980957 [Patellaria atrata CBS 101060]|uniref:PH domain-containing protein n=1 Tax=Patellaria atrata CBS 101060 TaxID=1346257 RepID=A0A9P4VN11_9PEZI|nr:hypothetical protein M501DRAFT_980957 [Patellaria atrata CBS 101060]